MMGRSDHDRIRPLQRVSELEQEAAGLAVGQSEVGRAVRDEQSGLNDHGHHVGAVGLEQNMQPAKVSVALYATLSFPTARGRGSVRAMR